MDYQTNWVALLAKIERQQELHAGALKHINDEVAKLQGMLGDHGQATDHLSTMSTDMVAGAPGAKATREVLSMLMEAKREHNKAIAQLAAVQKTLQAAYAAGMRAALRVHRAAGEVGGI